jgi:uncharacterized RDD family membrane protein YckC
LEREPDGAGAPLPPTPVEFPTRASAAVPGGDRRSFDSLPSGEGADVVGELSMKTPAAPLPRGARPSAAERMTAAGDRAGAPALPLFEAHGDDPPAQLRAGPRPPLAVRRTPDSARVRALAREVAPATREIPVLQFADPSEVDAVEPRAEVAAAANGAAGAPAARRVLAAGVDAGILGGLGLVVVALTLRMLDLPFSAWRVLPLWPMGGFLSLIAFAYLCAFTAVGGQTVGQMIAGVRVVELDGGAPSPAVAVRRAVATLVSAGTLGLGFLPALARPDRLALHDRLAGTRVVDDSRS